jgi:diguanylate cyclase (GGDEF)-like protein
MTTAKARYRLGNKLMKIAEPAMRNALGVRRVLGLTVLLAAVAAVAYLERFFGGDFDLRLVYLLIVLSGAMLLPRSLALAIAAAVAIVSVGITGATGVVLIINGLTHLLMYGYAALLTSNWEQERRRLMRMSRIDGLTGLRNLRALQEQLPTWLGPAARTGRRMAVMMVDVDGFKEVNDHLGHGVGNELLKELANLLRFAVRVGDEPYRFGGDEFVLLLSDADGDGASIVATRIQEIYASMGQTLRGTDVQISFSIGIAVFPDDGATPEVLLGRADEALYAAKRSGPGKIARYEAAAAA